MTDDDDCVGDLIVDHSGSFTIRLVCDAAAPLVVNGAGYAGCQLERDHEGHHEFTVYWERS